MKVCDMCPFVKDCAKCPNQGGVSVVAQGDSVQIGYDESAPNGAAPAGNRGLTIKTVKGS